MKTAYINFLLSTMLLVIACSASNESEESGVGSAGPLPTSGLPVNDQPQSRDVKHALSEPDEFEQTSLLGDRCGSEPFRKTLFLSASRHAWILTEKFSGGSTIPAFIRDDPIGGDIESSMLEVFDFIRDHYKQDHFKLELDADFLVVCDGGSPIGLQPTRVINSRLRRYRREEG